MEKVEAMHRDVGVGVRRVASTTKILFGFWYGNITSFKRLEHCSTATV